MSVPVNAFGLHDWVPVTRGESGANVRRSPDGTRFAKVVGAHGVADLAAERDRLAWISGQDIPTAALLDWQERADGACLVTSTVPGIGADRLDATNLERAWVGIGEQVRRVHALPLADCPFHEHDLTARITLARDVVGRGAVNPAFLSESDRRRDPTEILADLERDLPRMLALEARDAVVCHGDCCLPNIMVDPETLAVTGFIDLGRLGVADRHADLALLTANARETWPDEPTAQRLDLTLVDAAAYGMPFDPDRLAFYLRLDPLTWG